MAMVWRIHLKSDLTDSPNYGEYCLKNKIAAMGWILEKHNPDIASGKISIDSFADYEACAKAEGMDCNQIRLLAEEIKPGDFIWTYVDGNYYLAQVAADSRYRYNADDEAVAYRACNQLTNINWKCVGTRKDVDEKILKRLQRGTTLCRLFAPKNPNFAFGLQYTQEVFKGYLSVPDKFTSHELTNRLMTKKFFEDVAFIHTSASGAMGDAGVLEVWNKRFEHYKCYWTSKTAEKLSKAFLPDDDVPDFQNPKKSGWCFYYMGCGHNLYIKEEFAEAYLKYFGGDVYPDERIMLKVLSGGR